MQIIDKYLRKTILSQFILVLSVLMSLFIFITFIDELGSINRGSYGLLKIAQFVVLSVPKIMYEVFPIAALIGAILGLSALAKDSELIIFRSVGVSVNRIVGSTLKVGVLLGIVAIILGELIAPFSESKALRVRAEAIQTKVSKARAKKGTYDDGTKRWVLNNLNRTLIDPDRAFADQVEVAKWETKVDPQILRVFLIKPEQLSMTQLLKYIDHLKDNNQETNIYKLSFWMKVVAPFTTLAMLVLAVPFVFKQVRSGGLGKSLFLGIMMGLGFFILTKAFGYFVLLYNIPPFIGAIIPTIIVLLVSMFMVKRVV